MNHQHTNNPPLVGNGENGDALNYSSHGLEKGDEITPNNALKQS